ncbi:MAG TPA: hypothetical protein VMU24_01970, partial [Candidatus Acidoferrales bacterium]|nr:hypothetical protein [Candidatus Acidoferrales bacterium]
LSGTFFAGWAYQTARGGIMKVILLFLFGIPLIFVCFGLLLGALGLLLVPVLLLAKLALPLVLIVLAVKLLMEPGRV